MTRDTRLYVGNLPPDTREKDVDDLFAKYGKISFIDLKNRRGPPFAFVEYDDPRDAEDAVRGRDGYDMDGFRLRVEFPRGQGPRGPGGRPMYGGDRGGSGGGGGGGSDRFERDRGGYGAGYGALGRPRGGGRRTSHRVIVSGLPPTGSWQDLKDHMREAGDVCYTDVYKDGTGVVEFARSDDVKYAVRKLDDTKFRSHEGETSYIRVKEDTAHRDRSRSPRRSPHRSRSRSPRRDRSRSPKYSSPRRSRSRSPSRSRSRSRS